MEIQERPHTTKARTSTLPESNSTRDFLPAAYMR